MDTQLELLVERANRAHIAFLRAELALGWEATGKDGWRLGPVDFAKSTCDRTLYGDALREFIEVYGNLDQLAEGELEKWIASFPAKVHEDSNAFTC